MPLYKYLVNGEFIVYEDKKIENFDAKTTFSSTIEVSGKPGSVKIDGIYISSSSNINGNVTNYSIKKEKI